MAEVKTNPVSKEKLAYKKRQRTKEMRMQVTSFALMIFMTFFAFLIVDLGLDANFVIAVIIFLAFIQVILQFYYFMHMKDSGHEFFKLMILTGMFFAITFVVAFMYIAWIGERFYGI